jgi:hypothetical protein
MSNTLMHLPICLDCRAAEGLPKCNGFCACPFSNRSINEHAISGECPKGKFKVAAEKPKAVAKSAAVGETSSKGCGCSRKRKG